MSASLRWKSLKNLWRGNRKVKIGQATSSLILMEGSIKPSAYAFSAPALLRLPGIGSKRLCFGLRGPTWLREAPWVTLLWVGNEGGLHTLQMAAALLTYSSLGFSFHHHEAWKTGMRIRSQVERLPGSCQSHAWGSFIAWGQGAAALGSQQTWHSPCIWGRVASLSISLPSPLPTLTPGKKGLFFFFFAKTHQSDAKSTPRHSNNV